LGQAVDILTEIPGVDFDPTWESSVEHVVDTANGVKANFISREDLITAKLASARPQDLADVDALRAAAENQPAPQTAEPPDPSGPK